MTPLPSPHAQPACWTSPPHWTDHLGPRPLLMITTSYPTGPENLAGHFIRTLSHKLAAEGHAITIVTPAGPLEPWQHDAARPGRHHDGPLTIIRASFPGWRRGPFHTHGLPDAFESNNFSRLALSFSVATGLIAVAQEVLSAHPDPRLELVGHWLWPGGGIAQICARLLNRSATTICHSGGVRLVSSLPQPIASPLVQLALGDGPFIVTCDELLLRLSTCTSTPISPRAHVAPMPAPDLKRSTTPPSAPPFRVLTLSRLVPIKGLDLLIRACAGFDNIALDICGDGPELRDLRCLAEQHNVNARFHGVVFGDTKSSLLSSAHGFALTSRKLASGRTEGSPVALQEALSLEIPCLLTDVGGIPQAVGTYPDAVLASPSVKALKEAMPGFLSIMRKRWSRTT